MLLLFIAFLFLAACGDKLETGPAAPEESPESLFADPELDAAVRRALNQPGGPLPQDGLLALDSLDAPQQGIERLDGIGLLANLKIGRAHV